MGNCGGGFREPPPAPPPQYYTCARANEKLWAAPPPPQIPAPPQIKAAPPPPQIKAAPIVIPEVKAAPILEEKPEVTMKMARESMGVDCFNYYNFVVCGQSGVGKSSLINALLSLTGNDACDVGETETTQQIRWFTNKKFWPHLKIWDIPGGAGMKDHPIMTYFIDKKLYAFDAILILTSDRFLEVDFKILEFAMKYGTPCAFVRTKCDIAVKSRAKRDKVNAFEASQRLRADVKRSFHDGLAKAGLLGSDACVAPKLFFISNAHEYSPHHNNIEAHDDAYTIYDPKTKSLDISLPSMDEEQLLTYLVEAAERRQQTNKASK